MITLKTVEGKEVEFENVAKVFDTDRKTRNEYFGKYVAEASANPLKLDVVAAKIKMLETEYKLYLANLNVLAEAVDVEKKAADAKKLRDQVNEMTDEQLAALKEAIEAKEKQN